jgi:elongation factor G
MSETHLHAVCDLVLHKCQFVLGVGELEVIYLETIRRNSEGEGKYIRQTGGHGNYGHVKLRLDPGRPGSGYQFANEIKGGQIPPEFVEPVRLGVLGAAHHGILAGFEMVDLRVVLYDGSYHDKDSNELAFMNAGSIAFREAARKAIPIVLEPVMSVEVKVAEKHLAGVIDDLKRRRGRIDAVECHDATAEVHAIVPLAEMLLTSTHGRPEYPMHFEGYEPAQRGDPNNGDGAGVTANRPEGPRTGRGSAFAEPDLESE